MSLGKNTSLPMPPSSPRPKRNRTVTWMMQRKSSVLIFVLLSFFLLLPLLRTLRASVCTGSGFLSVIGICPTVFTNAWRLFYHLGGNGPWIPKIDGINYSDASLPEHCSVDQVHMLSRHAERYPTKSAGGRHLDLIERLQNSNVTLTGSLSFLEAWAYFTEPSDPAFENLTASGPYAGTHQATHTGKALRQHYDHLVSKARPTKFWSGSASRDVQTARYFGDGFFGPEWEVSGAAELVVIPEVASRGADTLTPGDTCSKYRTAPTGHDYGYGKLEQWQKVFTKPIGQRLAQDAIGMEFSHLDIYSMMEMCGFETLARGASPWCDVFTQEEWLHFEYARDLLHFYRAGPGNSYAGAMGFLWLNATQDLMSNKTSKDVYFSFVHDGDIVPVMATLQVLNERLILQELPTGHMKEDRRWRTSDVVPMGGRLIFERIACEQGIKTSSKEHFVRLFINDGLMKLPGLPSVQHFEHAVRLTDFQKFIASRGEFFGDFREVCSLPEDAADRITFLHQ
ncbi:3-phytase phyB [Exophiala viscosa]|uniref:3-phytase phyB n=1 Tax=Exophiala viscosa TaxID=2486360 RepID=UPI002196FB91|nr:3-phytase phyB [Exophiala viscosa]